MAYIEPDELDYTAKYNSPLPLAQEQQFQDWMGKQSQAVGRDISKDLYDYDMRGWWQQRQKAAPWRGAPALSGGHLTDTFKKPNHPTFSTGSQYHGINGAEGGTWDKRADGSYTFTPGRTNLENHELDELQDYFRRVEPGNQLILPQTGM